MHSSTIVAKVYQASMELEGPGIVHRIDKDTSGLMVAAKSDKAHKGLAKQFAKQQHGKSLLCYLLGGSKPNSRRNLCSA